MSNLSAREELELRQMGQRGWLVSEMKEFLTKRERQIRIDTLREAAAHWDRDYNTVTREHPKNIKWRAALRSASQLAGARAEQMEKEI